MNSEQFAQIFDQQMKVSSDILFQKAGEYATDDDRLHNFNVAAVLNDQDPTQALAGMMVKHTTSVYDMVRAGDPTQFPMEQWDEKITDHINYLILLKAAVVQSYADAEHDHPQLPIDFVGTQPA